MESTPEPPQGSQPPVGDAARSVNEQAAQQAAASAAAATPKSGRATASMVLGIVALVALLCSWLILALPSLVLGILAIVYGQLARKDIEANPEIEGQGQAVAGFVMGIIATSLSAVMLIVLVIAGISANG